EPFGKRILNSILQEIHLMSMEIVDDERGRVPQEKGLSNSTLSKNVEDSPVLKRIITKLSTDDPGNTVILRPESVSKEILIHLIF
ncbi:18108_t:CDS:2, partial [Dentiscutata erythropus]